jgi:hypothetical protein
MHRSGTSAVTGALGLLGAAMPTHGLELAEDNPKGHFESAGIVALHERVLASGGARWWDWDRFPDAWYETADSVALADELAELLRLEFGQSPIFVVKDPRACILVPLWRRVIALLELDAVAVLPYRNPVDVARSLRKRDGFPTANGHLAWLRYVLQAEVETRNLRRVFLRYEDLVRDWRQTLKQVVGQLGLSLPRQSARAYQELENFIDPALRHNAQDTRSLGEVMDHPWITSALRSYNQLQLDPYDGHAQDDLDGLRTDFDRACMVFTAALHGTTKGFEDAQRRNALIPQLEAKLAASELAAERVSALEAEVAELRKRPLELPADVLGSIQAATGRIEEGISALAHVAERQSHSLGDRTARGSTDSRWLAKLVRARARRAP